MNGITKVIEELGQMILRKDIELSEKQQEIDNLKDKIKTIECYIDALESYTDSRDKNRH